MRRFSSPQRRPSTTPQERARWVRRYERSGLSQREFAGREGLGLFALRQWIAQGRKANRAKAQLKPLWRELKLDGLAGVPHWAAEVVRPDGWTVRVAANAPASLLAEVLRVR
jgi:transposase-like protein